MNDEMNLQSENNTYKYFVPLVFNNEGKRYFFSTNDAELMPGDKVVVETVRGYELGVISDRPKEMSDYSAKFDLRPILYRASEEDYEQYLSNLELAEESLAFTEREVDRLGLEMNLISGEYTLDRAKFIVTYLADHRVDFRELLRTMASQLKTRIELRQIGTRDKAKMIGGIGICGLPLCCTTWMNEFDGISINRAKNQMLALNIPKISGHCGKLVCCLAFEDDYYTEAKKQMPRPNQALTYNGDEFRVNSINVISKTIVITNSDARITLSLEDYNNALKSGAIKTGNRK
ncbi:MAG: stage 0 sporulation protein [Erysipelotrichaceae bacterium]|nr:stage 0 sporulation protein [Erysipelotrichaceae bacterium]